MQRLFLTILCLLIQPVYAVDLDPIKFGLDVKEQIKFTTPQACDAAIRQALAENQFTAGDKKHFFEQGPTVFAVHVDKTHKSISKCLLDQAIIVTVVIGEKANLAKAVKINQRIQEIQQNTVAPDSQPMEDNVSLYGYPEQYDKLFFVALHALPETRDLFAELGQKDPAWKNWQAFYDYEVQQFLDKPTQQWLLQRLHQRLRYQNKRLLLQKVARWCAAYQMLFRNPDLAFETSLDTLMQVPVTRQVVAEHTPRALLQGAGSLASAESNELIYHLLNTIAALDPPNVFKFYQQYFQSLQINGE